MTSCEVPLLLPDSPWGITKLLAVWGGGLKSLLWAAG